MTRCPCCAARIPAARAPFFPGFDLGWCTTVRSASLDCKAASHSAVPSWEPSSTTNHSAGQCSGNCCPRQSGQIDCSAARSLWLHKIRVTPIGSEDASPISVPPPMAEGCVSCFERMGLEEERWCCTARCQRKSQAILRAAGRAHKAAPPMSHRASISTNVGVVDSLRPALYGQAHHVSCGVAKGGQVERVSGGDQGPAHVALGIMNDVQRLLSR